MNVVNFDSRFLHFMTVHTFNSADDTIHVYRLMNGRVSSLRTVKAAKVFTFIVFIANHIAAHKLRQLLTNVLKPERACLCMHVFP